MQARRRRPAAALAAAAALFGLTACEQPTPLVTIYSGQTSINDRAFSYCFEGQDPAAEPGTEGACRYDVEGRQPKVLEVRPGDQVLVDVDKALADAGWYVVLRGAGAQASRLAVQEEHVTRFQPDFSQSPTITVEIRKVVSPEDDSQTTGLWQFVVVPR